MCGLRVYGWRGSIGIYSFVAVRQPGSGHLNCKGPKPSNVVLFFRFQNTYPNHRKTKRGQKEATLQGQGSAHSWCFCLLCSGLWQGLDGPEPSLTHRAQDYPQHSPAMHPPPQMRTEEGFTKGCPELSCALLFWVGEVWLELLLGFVVGCCILTTEINLPRLTLQEPAEGCCLP